MTPSIMRRFARYHQINRTFGVNIDEDILWLAKWMWDTGDTEERKRRIVQSLTRIEDAEMLLDRVEEFTAPLLAESQEARRLREFYAFDADRLLVKAGIDPELWAKVKE